MKFLDLPRGIRIKIYKHFFSSTTLVFGGPVDLDLVKPGRLVPDSLAILGTCLQIKHEASPLWLGLVEFSFQNPLCMVKKLSRLSSAILSGIRYLHLKGCQMYPNKKDYDDYWHHSLEGFLKLFPWLRLHRLTIFEPSAGDISYSILDRLIDQGNGWQELWFITPNSKMLGFDNERIFIRGRQQRFPQPGNWNTFLSWRDGINSGTSVTIYRSTMPNSPGSVMNKHTRQPFKQGFDIEAPADSGEDNDLMAENEGSKELLVIVKRGLNAHIRERRRMFKDLDYWTYDASWEQIRHLCYDFSYKEVQWREMTRKPKPSPTSFPPIPKIWGPPGTKPLPYRSYSNMFDGWLV
ncbi:hypothetical protein N7488_002050 [Penicillium malachiteum]|nr:hypothetical protein N7488_002050 [Penicillium malachiteum]